MGRLLSSLRVGELPLEEQRYGGERLKNPQPLRGLQEKHTGRGLLLKKQLSGGFGSAEVHNVSTRSKKTR
jgi:hypothetical protein